MAIYDAATPSPGSGADARLAVATLAGDCDAIAEIYSLHGAGAYASAFRLLCNDADTEDVVQELFAALPATIRGYEPLTGPLGPWLRRVAVRLALMRLRTARRRREVDVDSVAQLLAPREALIERMTIENALARLGEQQRTVFLLKEVEGYAHREIAALLEISVANSEVCLFRARQALRAMLGSSR